jgi:nitrate/TMAO reductase-like tetraheme cytochrome c subunit
MGASFKLNKHEFNRKIEEYKQSQNVTYIQAILSVCERENIEPDTIGKIISKDIKEKVDLEGQQLNLRPKTAKLPI